MVTSPPQDPLIQSRINTSLLYLEYYVHIKIIYQYLDLYYPI